MRQLQTAPTTTTTTTASATPTTPPTSPHNFIVACLEVLAWLPQKWFVSERKQFFSSSLAVPEDGGDKVLQTEEIRVEAICNLPLFLARIGHEHVTEFDAKIWYCYHLFCFLFFVFCFLFLFFCCD
jgi:hypothetical protein